MARRPDPPVPPGVGDGPGDAPAPAQAPVGRAFRRGARVRARRRLALERGDGGEHAPHPLSDVQPPAQRAESRRDGAGLLHPGARVLPGLGADHLPMVLRLLPPLRGVLGRLAVPLPVAGGRPGAAVSGGPAGGAPGRRPGRRRPRVRGHAPHRTPAADAGLRGHGPGQAASAGRVRRAVHGERLPGLLREPEAVGGPGPARAAAREPGGRGRGTLAGPARARRIVRHALRPALEQDQLPLPVPGRPGELSDGSGQGLDAAARGAAALPGGARACRAGGGDHRLSPRLRRPVLPGQPQRRGRTPGRGLVRPHRHRVFRVELPGGRPVSGLSGDRAGLRSVHRGLRPPGARALPAAPAR